MRDLVVYRVRNKHSGEYLYRGGYKKGTKTIWTSRGAAANAWNAEYQYRLRLKYSRQKDWEVVPFHLVPA